MSSNASFAFFFFFNDTATTEIYTLSLHDALPIFHPGLHLAPDAGSPEGVLVSTGERGDRHPRGGQRRLQLVVEREPLQSVVGVADRVEVATHPASPQISVGRADLPEVARGEVRLVRMRVSDRRSNGDLAFAVQGRERLQNGCQCKRSSSLKTGPEASASA